MEVLERIISTIRRQVSTLRLSSANTAVSNAVNLVNSSVCRIGKTKLRPLTRDNILYYYTPIQGLASYTTLSISIMNPQIIVRISPHRDITSMLVLSAGCGAGLWLWDRPHLAAASPARRFSWAFLGGSMWTLGSILMWAILRSAVNRKPVIGMIVGLATGATLTHAAIDYFHYVEVMFCGEVHLPEEMYNSDEEKYDNDLDI